MRILRSEYSISAVMSQRHDAVDLELASSFTISSVIITEIQPLKADGCLTVYRTVADQKEGKLQIRP